MNIGETQEVHEISPKRIEAPPETDVIPDDLTPAEPKSEPTESEPTPDETEPEKVPA